MEKAVEQALRRVEHSANLVYRFSPGSYTALLISDIAAVRIALEPPPDWIKELEEWRVL